jgi:hypothetical protein
MTKRRKLALFGVAILAAIVLANFYASDLIGWSRGEAKYLGRYTNSWESELRHYRPLGEFINDGASRVHYVFLREPTNWEKWRGELIPGLSTPAPDNRPPLQEGDPDAVGVLVELLKSPHSNVRIMAANGLEHIGPAAHAAIPALLVAWDGGQYSAWQALKAIDPTVANEAWE